MREIIVGLVILTIFLGVYTANKPVQVSDTELLQQEFCNSHKIIEFELWYIDQIELFIPEEWDMEVPERLEDFEVGGTKNYTKLLNTYCN